MNIDSRTFFKATLTDFTQVLSNSSQLCIFSSNAYIVQHSIFYNWFKQLAQIPSSVLVKAIFYANTIFDGSDNHKMLEILIRYILD